jgi:hypothetical protein
MFNEKKVIEPFIFDMYSSGVTSHIVIEEFGIRHRFPS